MPFKEGDTVTRITGGPFMTVEDTRTDGFIAVVWHDRDDRVQRDCFHPRTLLKWITVEAWRDENP